MKSKVEGFVKTYVFASVLILGVLLLIIGWLVGILSARTKEGTVSPVDLILGALTGIGTVGAAIAAFWAAKAAARSARLTQATYDDQIKLDEERRKPSLIISDATWDDSGAQDGFRIEFANLGQYPVFVRTCINDAYNQPSNIDLPLDIFLPAAAKEEKLITVSFPFDVVEGELRFFFLYGATGLIYHRIAIPYKIETTVINFAEGVFEQEQIALSAKQSITMNIGSESDLLEKKLLAERCFDGFDWNEYLKSIGLEKH